MTAFSDAIAFAAAHETPWARDPAADPGHWGIHLQDPPPWNVLRGPVHARGPSSGTIVHRGVEVAAWGDPDRADLTFSIAKTYLALLAGVAHDRGLLPDVHEPVIRRVPGIGFEGGRNPEITWHQLLQQTSEWEGSVFGLPEQVDRWRAVQYQPVPPAGRKGDARPLQAPGSYWEYNDVRINQLSLALLHLFGRPLPEVFAEAIMRPIGASDRWRWEGYRNAWVTVRGRRM
ncbi:MAG: serine hydrolase, partial [Burkholderiales bacterium]